MKLASAVAVAAALYLGLRPPQRESLCAAASSLLAGIALSHIVFALTGTSLAAAEAAGWLFTPPEAVGLTSTWKFDDLACFPWNVLPALTGDLLAVMFVTAISTLLNTTGLEFVTKREADLQRELKTVGVANSSPPRLGGYVSTIALNRTTLNYLRRRARPPFRPDRSGGFGAHAHRRSRLPRLCAEIRARRPACSISAPTSFTNG